MNAQPTAIAANNKQNRTTQDQTAQEIDLMALLGALIDRKYFIATVTAVFMAIGVFYAVFATPVYQATAMIQVEDGGASVPGFDDMAGMFESTSAAVTEIELLKSRSVIGEAVDTLKLDIVAQPKLFPVIGNRAFRKFTPMQAGEVAEPSFGASSYAWGGESIDVFRFDVPSSAIGEGFTLIAGEGTGKNKNFTLINGEDEVVLKGKVGEELTNGKFSLTIRSLIAHPDTEFTIVRKDRLNTVLDLQKDIGAGEKGKDSGIIDLSLQSESAELAEKVLDKVAAIYVRRNVERNSAEAQKSLEFLEVQLPEVKKQLEYAEQRFNDYQIKRQSIDITLETQGVLEQVVELETKLQELELKRLELSRKFKESHPTYQGVLEQIEAVEKQKQNLVGEVGNLPETQQELLRLKRDVEVSNQIYTLLLSKTQELDIVRAGTVGNVRIIDHAEVNTSKPVKPKKALIVVMATMLGGMLAVAIVLIQKAIHKGVEDPNEIEALGLPVYASVPYSDYQDKLTGFSRARKGKDKPKSILAVDNPADLSIEALRSLRTSLHFAMMEAKNNIIAISGPSPGVGKSFISVNLATVLAQSGKKVLIIDADMRKGYLQTQFGMKWDDGLSDLLSGRLNLEQVTKTSQVKDLDVITRGQIPPNPSELLMHSNFTKLVEQVKEKYDIVIIDTPPILAVTDPAIVSAHTGTTLLVARFGQNHAREVELTRNRFEQNGIDVKGVVFNGVLRKASNAYGYYGYYNYEYKSGN
ncbi:polysaccharide biosynthesis tyrosine autokinase [Pseudoalteromonas shioyasakiensis]|uniref:Polysaccharide biosynthesis tyrosine autokinase n=1 Tax=Pseudoalteromonas shioyasakiensis TaxID=1190813 RepID=A0ABT6U501_9GAMM|nr:MULTISPECIES: polysaccharide biosynthesis tyrosine autokinase [Pseudoalteromonas]MDI4671263.1 polysaccharide biosynthesis tyrosine autokinase [Pseudoalteromonas shioyasakiensis]MDI4673390.1 polysaccharide biosynthesis tyrosine autokinase [Pseudoalteromonas shioyasakiensis]MDI4688172.1 polysaccharide biosynthesis tyrosine autokinase [Pseudoalteromonas shioyasakiensis]MDI4706768.1 polysaccharide biosynthesis tyrosine autokinase [Pseudoalteromonas shioyasakiensis]NUJ23484.1 polysaccharide bios